MPLALEREREVACRAVMQASRLCRTVQAEITPDTLAKKDKSPVTVADFGSQAIIGRILADAFPGDPLVAEEDSTELRESTHRGLLDAVVRHVVHHVPDADEASVLRGIDHGAAESSSGRFWTLDPIDGTKGFLRREQYAIALALLEGGRPVLAALACPNLCVDPGNPDSPIGALFLAVRGQGTQLRALQGGDTEVGRRVRVTPLTDVARLRFCESVESSHSDHGHTAQLAALLGITSEPVRMDSQAKYGVVARGEADLYLRLPTSSVYREKIWDHAAGALVIEEAGGRVTDLDGKPLDFTQGRTLASNRGIIASCGTVHDRVLEALASLKL
jgi:3'(2'), 5'-bisphosphate nucleotidase